MIFLRRKEPLLEEHHILFFFFVVLHNHTHLLSRAFYAVNLFHSHVRFYKVLLFFFFFFPNGLGVMDYYLEQKTLS